MRVAWIQDNSRPHGGAELSNRCVVEVGHRMGFNIVGVTPQWFPHQVLKECDVMIINNFFQFSYSQRTKVAIAMRDKPYVKYEHDHRELGRPQVSKPLFANSRLNVFLSPMHLANHKAKLEIDGVALPLAIREQDFRPVPGMRRVPRSALIVGGWVRGGKIGRELQRFVAARTELTFTSVGLRIAGARAVPHIPLARMPELYSSHEILVHLPDMLCAGERVIFEAALCGCNIKANHLVGHMSWGYDLDDTETLRAILRKAPIRFWELVKEKCQ